MTLATHHKNGIHRGFVVHTNLKHERGERDREGREEGVEGEGDILFLRIMGYTGGFCSSYCVGGVRERKEADI